MAHTDDERFMRLALAEAERGVAEGGVPIGAVLTRGGAVVAAGRNKRVQEGDPIAHGEMDCLRAAGRQRTYRDTTLYTTLSPCMMCSGAILQLKIPRVVIGEAETFPGDPDFLRGRGVAVDVLGLPECVALMRAFIRDRPELWNEDIMEDGAG